MQRVHTCTGFIYVDAFSYFLAQGAQADSVPHDNPGVNLVQGCAVHDWYGSKGRSTTMNFQACLLEREREIRDLVASSQINLLPRRPIRVGWPVLTCPANPMCDVAMQFPTSWADIPQGVWICLNGPREVRTEQRHKLLQICILFAQMENKDLDMWTEPRMGLMNIRRVVNNADKRQNIAQTQL